MILTSQFGNFDFDLWTIYLKWLICPKISNIWLFIEWGIYLLINAKGAEYTQKCEPTKFRINNLEYLLCRQYALSTGNLGVNLD